MSQHNVAIRNIARYIRSICATARDKEQAWRTMGLPRRQTREGTADALGALSARIMDMARHYQLRSRDRVCRHDLTVGQCYALEAVVYMGELSVTELGRHLAVNKSNASRVAEALVALGLCKFTSVRGNARIKQIVPTLPGTAVAGRIHAQIRSEHRRALRHVPAAELRACERVLAALEEAQISANEEYGRPAQRRGRRP